MNQKEIKARGVLEDPIATKRRKDTAMAYLLGRGYHPQRVMAIARRAFRRPSPETVPTTPGQNDRIRELYEQFSTHPERNQATVTELLRLGEPWARIRERAQAAQARRIAKTHAQTQAHT